MSCHCTKIYRIAFGKILMIRLQKHDGKLTYEGIQQIEYLDKVVSGKTHSFKYIYIFRKEDILTFITLILL